MSEIRKIKPSLSKGTRDFLPREVAKRNFIFDTIKSVFRKYGFEEIETPAIEKLETLTGKYGEEGDKLLFKILNSGDYLKDVPNDKFQNQNYKELTNYIAEKGLRYDLTVPLARYVVMNQENLPFPFKRFHIGPVWRADRPQKGRYQEFYQCDADVIGSTSLLNEVELTMIYLEAFEKLGVNVTIRMNNRKLIDEILNISGIAENKTAVITLLDKLDKVEWKGEKGIEQQLIALGLTQSKTNTLFDCLNSNNYLQFIEKSVNTEVAKEVKSVSQFFEKESRVLFDPTLMRGLDYYTGTVWEVRANGVQMGSIAAGGRYDNLTEMFGGQNMSGVGISFGIERIYDVMEELNLFPTTISQGVLLLFVPREEAVEAFTFQQVQALRDAGIGAEIFLGNVKKQKQFKYIEDKDIPYMVEIGENEVKSAIFRLKNAQKREIMGEFNMEQLIAKFSKTQA